MKEEENMIVKLQLKNYSFVCLELSNDLLYIETKMII